MYGNGYGNFIGKGASKFVPIPQYQAVLDATIAWGGTLPSLKTQIWHNKVLKECIDDGKWPGLNYFVALQHDASTYHYGMVDWKNPTGPKATLRGALEFRNLIGYKGDQLTGSILTEFNPFTDASYNPENCSIGVFGDDDFSNNGFLFGATDGTRQLFLANFATDQKWTARIGSGTTRLTNDVTKTAKHNAISYNGSNVVISVGNNDYSFPQTGASTKVNAKICLLGRNLFGTSTDGLSAKTISYMYAGDATLPAYFENKLEAAFLALRPAYTSYSLLADIDINNTAIMWQDAAKTIPAADGQPVRVISGGAWGDFVASSDSARGILKANGLNSRRTLLLDGDNDNYNFPTISGDMWLIFVYKNTNVSTGSQLMSSEIYITITGSGYPGNTELAGEYFITHPVNGSSSAGIKLKNPNNAFNTIAHLANGSVKQDINGLAISGRKINPSVLSLNKMGDPFNSSWRPKGELARILIYQGCPPDSLAEQKIYEMNTLYNI